MKFQGAPDEVLTIPTARDACAGASFAINEPVLGYRAWLIEPRCDGDQPRSVLASAQWASTPGAWTGRCAGPMPGAGLPSSGTTRPACRIPTAPAASTRITA